MHKYLKGTQPSIALHFNSECKDAEENPEDDFHEQLSKHEDVGVIPETNEPEDEHEEVVGKVEEDASRAEGFGPGRSLLGADPVVEGAQQPDDAEAEHL